MNVAQLVSMKNTFQTKMPRKILWKSARRKILKDINNCQVIACFGFFFTNNGTIILFKAWVGSWRKPAFRIFFLSTSPLLPNKTDRPLVFLMQLYIIRTLKWHIYTLGEAKDLLVEAKNCKILSINKNTKQQQKQQTKSRENFLQVCVLPGEKLDCILC